MNRPAIFLAIAACLSWGGWVTVQLLSPSTGRIGQAVHDYLLAHPETIAESLKAADAQSRQKQTDASRAAIVANRKALFENPADPAGGNPKGDVTIVEFFDYRCPYCKQVEPLVETILKDDANLRIVYKEFPILGPESLFATRVAFAALGQGKYTQFHVAMMAAKGDITEEVILKVAGDASLDVDKIKSELNAPETEQSVKHNYDLANALGITGTPAFVIGDILILGAVDLAALKQAVANARKLD